MRYFVLLFAAVISLSSCAWSQDELSDLVLVIDPGHGDRAWGEVPSDSGAVAEVEAGTLQECFYTWDTAMRLKRLAEEKGAKVYLTMESDSYDSQDWSPGEIPEWRYKKLVDIPQPHSEYQALLSRVSTGNRRYLQHCYDRDVVFFSLHFDSTNPDLAGVSFYYPTWCEKPPFVDTLTNEIRARGRARRSLRTGLEYHVARPYNYAVLSQAFNPDSYLIELGNMRSFDCRGSNPDLWRMRDTLVREDYAQMLVSALTKRPEQVRPAPASRLTFLLIFVLVLLAAKGVRRAWRTFFCRDTHIRDGEGQIAAL